jgi:hypothetical protein
MRVIKETYNDDYGLVHHYEVSLNGACIAHLDKSDYALADNIADNLAGVLGTEVGYVSYTRKWVADVS